MMIFKLIKIKYSISLKIKNIFVTTELCRFVHNLHMNNKSNFKLSAKKNPNQIDHLGRKRLEILNQALPRPQQILQGQGQAGSRRTTMMQSIT